MHRRGAWGRQPELGFARLPITQKKNEYWRRGWDSKPRYGYPYNGFRVLRFLMLASAVP